jgi:hypothetical protein
MKDKAKAADPSIAQTVIPAVLGGWAVVIGVDREDNSRPTAADVWTERLPVIAWRITDNKDGDNAQPIVPGCWPNGLVYYELESAWVGVFGRVDSLNEAKEEVLGLAQMIWDQEHTEGKPRAPAAGASSKRS